MTSICDEAGLATSIGLDDAAYCPRAFSRPTTSWPSIARRSHAAARQAFAPVLAKNGGGAIVNLNSVVSFVSFPILASYSASKAATHSLTQVTRAMLRGQNTQVFGVYPGPIDTKLAEGLPIEKTSPADAARAIVAGIIAGDEEIFPDKMSQGTGAAFFADPKGLERQVAGVPAAA
jgi:short-subunit dehydrogenase